MTPLLSRRGVVLPLFAAIAVAFTYPLFLAPMRLGHGDWLWFHFTWDSARRTIVGFHELPWWNPYSCGGSLGIANPQSFGASPLFWLLLPFPTALAMKLYLALCTFLGLWGTWELAVRHRAAGPFAIVAAMLFACSGTMGWHMNGQTSMAAFAGLPWVMLFTEKADDDARFAFAAGAVLATMTLSGGVYPTAMGVLLVGACFAVDVAAHPRRWPKLLGRSAAVALAFVGFASIKLVPMFEFLRDHGRPVGPDDAIGLSLVPKMLLEQRTTQTQMWPRGSYTYGWWGEYGNYVGYAGIALVLVLSTASGRRGLRALAVAGLGFALLLGDHGRLAPYRLLRALPMFGSLRVPTRYWVIVNLGMALAVAIGGARLAALPRRWAQSATAALLLLSAWVAVDLVRTNGVAVFSGAMLTDPAPRDEPPAPIRQVRGQAHAMYQYPPRNLGTLACFDEVSVEPSPRLQGGLPSELTVEPPAAGSVRLVGWSPSSITFDVELDRPARIAINQNGYRGWRTDEGSIDVRAHQLGVLVDAGTRRVHVRYRPLGYLWGLAGTGAALGLGFLALRPRRRARGLTASGGVGR